MDYETFDKIAKRRIEVCESVLNIRRDIYASDTDRLANFKKAGALQGVSPERALLGMAAKHIVAIDDFVHETDKKCSIPLVQWEEKITDIINYMILLEALVVERKDICSSPETSE